MFEQSTSPITVFETAPNGSGGDVFWIYEIQKPGEFFSGCETEDEASDRLIESDRSPDEQIGTCGYTLVLDHPEDPGRSVSSPDEPIILEVIGGRGQDQQYEFYQVEDPLTTIGDDWGDTPKMYDSLLEAGLDPILKYDNVSLIFQRPYGAL
jgi:hypothetical protein